MKLGFITACLPKRTLPQLCEWAAAEGYEALEVAAWPDLPLVQPRWFLGYQG